MHEYARFYSNQQIKMPGELKFITEQHFLFQ